jgi:hypothetical protein
MSELQSNARHSVGGGEIPTWHDTPRHCTLIEGTKAIASVTLDGDYWTAFVPVGRGRGTAETADEAKRIVKRVLTEGA